MFEPDFKSTFFGSHYSKLKLIKKIYDPVDLFVVNEGVVGRMGQKFELSSLKRTWTVF